MIDIIKYEQAIKLRKQGKNYNEISSKLNLSKSTISNWFAKKPWSEKIKSDLNSLRIKAAKKNLSKANITRLNNLLLKRKEYINEARIEFNKLVKNPLFLIGLGIYWGEGDKTDNGRVAVINTDPELLKIVVKFYRQCLNISENSLRIGLFIYEDIDQNKATKFWSKKLKISQSHFIKIQILKSRSKLTKNKSKYGICSLYFSNTKLNVKIHEWINLLSIHKLTNSRV